MTLRYQALEKRGHDLQQLAIGAVAVGAGAVVALAATLESWDFYVLMSLLATLVAAAGLCFRIRRIGIGFADPVVISVSLFFIVGFGGAVLYRFVAHSAPRSFPLVAQSPSRTLAVFSAFAACVTMGGALLSTLNVRQRSASNVEATINARVRGFAIGVEVLAIGSLAIGAGMTRLLQRETYQGFGVHPALLSAGELLAFPALLGASVSLSQGRHKVWHWFSLFGMAFYYFATSSRALALVPLFLLVGQSLSGVRVGRARISLAVLVSLVSLAVVLALRDLPEQGAVNYLKEILSTPLEFMQTGTSKLLQNVLQGFPLTDYVAGRKVVSSQAVLVSLNPMPSGFTGWNSVAPALRLNRYVPYNGLGTLAGQSWLFVCGYGLALGATFGASTIIFTGRLGRGLVMGCAVYVSLLLQQYNLRAGTRMAYYLLAAVLIVGAFKRKRWGKM